MKNNPQNWTKKELEVYILLLCSTADSKVTDEELSFIKSKVDSASFDKMYKEFTKDSEEDAFEKIDDNVQHHDFSPKEIIQIKTNMKSVFFADGDFAMREADLNRIIDNMLY